MSLTLRFPLRAVVASSSAIRSSRSAQQSPERSAASAGPPVMLSHETMANGENQRAVRIFMCDPLVLVWVSRSAASGGQRYLERPRRCCSESRADTDENRLVAFTL